MSAQQVVSIAEQQLGISGRPNKFTQWYGSIGGTTSYAWCVVFIGWCFSQAGLSLFPRTASVVCVLDYAKENGYFKSKGSYTPKAGDIMIQQSGGASHVGIVTGAGNNCFYTIEGNCSNSVKKVTRYYDGKLTGFFVPPYAENTAAVPVTDNDRELPKDPVLYDSFGTGGNTVNDAFDIDRDETYRFFAGGHDITEYIGNLSWQNTLSELATTMSFETANTRLIYSPLLRGNISHSLSIEEMKNSVKVVTEKDSVYTVKTVLKDEDSIYKYGFLQEVVKIDPDKENADTVAKQKLAERSKASETFSFEMIEAVNSYTRAGMILSVDDTDYLIESAQHSIKNDVHYVKVDLRKFG